MKFAYKFSNLMGTIYRKGNIVFTNDGNSVISPVGNKLTIFDLKNNKSKTLSLQSNFNYTSIALSPDNCLLVAVNEQGLAQMISMISHTVIYEHKFSAEVRYITFSPDGRYFAAAKENIVSIFKSPGELTGEYSGFKVVRHCVVGHSDILWIDWSTDSRFLIVGSEDNTSKILSIELYKNFRPILLSGHTDAIVGCFFEANSFDLNTISRNGQLCIWECSLKLSDVNEVMSSLNHPNKKKARKQDDEDVIDLKNAIEPIDNGPQEDTVKAENDDEDEDEVKNNGRDKQGKLVANIKKEHNAFCYRRLARHYLIDEVRKERANAQLTAVNYHKNTKLLITAYSTGSFYLHELPDVTLIHSLSISENAIQTACFNNTGDWMALGSSTLGQLLVWEWQSEQYVMKQQGHSSQMTSIAYSPDGQYIVTGGEDAKVKLWKVSNGFCFVTFHEHTSAITAVDFSPNKKFLVSASLDGTVRAYDIIRYRNFRTLTSPRPVQFASVAVDYSGEFVVAGGQDVFEIYLWSMKLGRLLEVLSGHEGPVVALAFSPVATSSLLVSGSWDKTIKVWNCLESSGDHETIDVSSDVTAVAFRPNGEEIAVASLSGNIQIFNVRGANQVASIEGRNDLGSGVSEIDIITAKKNLQGKCFTTIAFSADGESILAAGKSKNVCIYNVAEGILLKKFEITQNHSLDGLDEFINHRKLTEFGNLALIESRNPLEGGNVSVPLPGVQKGDMAARNFKPEVKVYGVRFSPTAQSWSAATTEGLLMFSLEAGIVFDPLNLSIEITPKMIRQHARCEDYSNALLMALKLNEPKLIEEVIEQIPTSEVELVVAALPDLYAQRVLDFVAIMITSSQHIEFYLHWSKCLLTIHGLKDSVFKHHTLLSIQDSTTRKYESLNKICDFNKYTLQVLIETANEKHLEEIKMDAEQNGAESEEEEDDDYILLKNGQNNRNFNENNNSTSEDDG